MFLARSFNTDCFDTSPRLIRAACQLLLLLVTVVPSVASADSTVDARAGVGGWQQQAEGDLRSGLSDVDVEDDLGIDPEPGVLAYFSFEHAVPIVPNLRFDYADTSLTGDEQLDRSIEVNGTVFGFSDQVSTEIELRQADALLYYEVLDNQLSFDVGVAARYIDGEIAVASSTALAEAEFKGALPLLYAGLRAELPLAGLWVGAQVRGAGYGGDQLVDVQARLGYQSKFGLGTQIGWRSLQLSLEDYDDLDEANIDISGPYVMLNFQF
ncbi:MAG: TIGR04219 family outer membrane beta-barrel protein [Pseudomonadales bacterium]